MKKRTVVISAEIKTENEIDDLREQNILWFNCPDFADLQKSLLIAFQMRPERIVIEYDTYYN